ncbi:MAG: UDP-N-acetylglucosamine--N-acetylmuramyl-(pentapeptide) pyrophosphoryl-undecaprenol N-acetylglucosamine transferase, partial [Deltaproteobacteria bacterium]|nr:UDP-N-acetylglucosamine--N-acetylmuramyl-(pentapeptide) pyrophosphoryl-undecaprenol N-acetylglucosamine transferase [Deltaproteobacteria bacterium]
LCPEADIRFAGTGRPAEAALVGPGHWPRVILSGRGFKGGSISGKVRSGLSALKGFGQALRLIHRFRPHLFYGVGGYVSGPAGLAARLTGRPVVLHEQNSRPGLSNRLLARLAREIFVGFPEAASVFPAEKTVVTGNPLRPEITALMDRRYDYAPGARLAILIMGGSQGAGRLNLAAMELAAKLAAGGRSFEIIHQTGAGGSGQIAEFYSRLGIIHETAPFFPDPERLYARAHLGLMRAGALTVTELAACGLPSILVPLPTAADNHQLVNARTLESCGAALILLESELENLFGAVSGLMDSPRKLLAMAGRGRSLVNPEADRQMAGRLLEIMGERI